MSRLTGEDGVSDFTVRRRDAWLLKIGPAPKTSGDLQNVAEGIAKRFDYNWREAYQYVERGNSTLINKARGLLAFNGLTLVSMSASTKIFDFNASDKWTTLGLVLVVLGMSLASLSASIRGISL